jgi:hypothetical protein
VLCENDLLTVRRQHQLPGEPYLWRICRFSLHKCFPAGRAYSKLSKNSFTLKRPDQGRLNTHTPLFGDPLSARNGMAVRFLPHCEIPE